MIRPIESSMSLFNVDHKAHQAQNDPNAHAAQAMQQDEAVKKTAQQMNTVQKSPETEGDVKISDRESEKQKGGQRQKRRRDGTPEAKAAPDGGGDDGGHLNFLA